MGNYDYDVLGVGNSQHPANERENSRVYPEGIEQAKKYFDETNDISCLEEEIGNVVQTLESTHIKLTEVILELRSKKEDDLANKLCRIRETLEQL